MANVKGVEDRFYYYINRNKPVLLQKDLFGTIISGKF